MLVGLGNLVAVQGGGERTSCREGHRVASDRRDLEAEDLGGALEVGMMCL